MINLFKQEANEHIDTMKTLRQNLIKVSYILFYVFFFNFNLSINITQYIATIKNILG